MRISCVHGHWHDVSPTGLAIIIRGFQDGDLIRTRAFKENGYDFTFCVLEAFTPERISDFKRRYKGNAIVVDGVRK
jgi:hypothetical protein